ncbi:MAG: hypothetical protein U0531_00130 [Dehalococcoidia bacterium]
MTQERPGQPYYSTDQFFSQAWHLRPYEDVALPIAVEMAEIVNEACRWFHDPRHMFLGDPGAPPFADDVVDEVCEAIQHQLDKEGQSRTRGATCSRHGVAHTNWYHLNELPAARRRALVERVWALRNRHGSTVRVWSRDDAPPPPPPPPYAPYGGLWP